MLTVLPWYKREETWTLVGGLLAILLKEYFGVELSIEAFVAMVSLIITIIVGTIVQRNKAMDHNAELLLMSKEIEIAEIYARANISRDDAA